MSKQRAEKSSGKQPRGRPFKKGQSGNPAGKKHGTINHVNRRIRELLSAQAEEITQSAIERAIKTGDPAVLRLVFDRLAPAPKSPPFEPYTLADDLTTMEGCETAMRQIAADVAAGILNEEHAAAISARIKDVAKLIDSNELEARLAALERLLTTKLA